MLLDPFEEEFHFPARSVNLPDSKRGQHEIVGEKLQSFVGLGAVIIDSPQSIRVCLGGIDGGQDHHLIGSHPGALFTGCE